MVLFLYLKMIKQFAGYATVFHKILKRFNDFGTLGKTLITILKASSLKRS